MRFHRRVPSTSRSETAGIPHLLHGCHASLPQSDGRLRLDQARASLQDSQQRLNINGVIDCNGLSDIVRYDDTINTQSTFKLFQQLVFLPPYAPNLNLIERFWKFFKKTILYGRHY